MEAAGTAPVALATAAGPIALTITSDLPSIASVWREIADAVVCTSAQTFDWARAWSTHVLTPAGRAPVIVVGHRGDGQVQFLLPFEIRIVAGLKVLTWLSQDHANYLFGLFRPAFAARLSKPDLARILNEVAHWSGASVAAFEAQPFAWGDTPNPFALLSHQPAPNSGYAIRLSDFETLYRSIQETRAARTPAQRTAPPGVGHA